MKRILIFMLCLLMALGITACDLNPIVNRINGKLDNSSTEGQSKENYDYDYDIYSEGAPVSNTVTIEFRDESGNVLLNNSDIVKVYAKFDPTMCFFVELKLTENGSEKFAAATRENLGKTISIYANDAIISSPIVNEEIKSESIIIANCSSQEEAFSLFDTLTTK